MKNFKITALLFFLCVLFSCDKADLLRNNPLDPKSKSFKASLPKLTTVDATSVTITTATLGGTSITDGGAPITAKGVCWGLTTNPTTANSKTSNGTGAATFVSNLTGLTASTKYYARAYATNSGGTAYGENVSFTTLAALTAPILTTTDASAIGITTAYSGGNVTSDGGASVTVRGVCWGTTLNPTIVLTTKTSDSLGVGIFTSKLTSLTAGTLYHVRAYATNSIATSYGNDITFTTITTATVPTITTTTVSGIAMTTAVSGGTISFDGAANVTDRGVCWGTSANPTIALATRTSDGTGTGTFVSNISGLTAGGIYHVRAFATNSVGTAYGLDVTFTASTTASVPTVTTSSISAFSLTTATGGGNVVSDGGANVSVRGLCWSTTANPTISSPHTSDGSGTGTYTSSLTGLTLGTLYHVRAYATNTSGTAYGSDITFTTLATAGLPTLTTTSISLITSTTATSGGIITADGGATVTDRGVCWSTSSAPTVALTTKTTKLTDGTGTGSFTSNLTSLAGNTSYHIRAYATNSSGTAYGNEITFNTSAAVIATITTTAISLNAGTTATSGGNITSDGGGAITVRGVCWSLTLNPSITDSKTTDGTGPGIFISNLTGLISGTNYHMRAYATNSVGTAYGQDIVFTAASISTLTTSAITGITQTTATGGGNITLDGGSPVTAYGICWSTSTNPTVALTTKTSDGTGTGTFYSYLTGLTSSTTYYVRAYATNAVGTAYGSNVTFTTSPPVTPTLQATTDLSAVTMNTATSGGNISADGFATITTKGVVWGTTTGPTVALGTKTVDATGGTGPFISNITGLASNSVYYVRAYATNSAGTGYGNEFILKTATGTMTDADGNTYYTVTIGTQLWMRDNLKTSKYRDGSFIANITDKTTWGSLITGAYCWYNNDITNKAAYGALYNWYTITDSRVLCPTSWHIPTDAEWTTMTSSLVTNPGYKLRETGNTHWTYDSGLETNESGFTALPGGLRNSNIGQNIGLNSYWWSATETNVTAASVYTLDYYGSYIAKTSNTKTIGMSVRCIHD